MNYSKVEGEERFKEGIWKEQKRITLIDQEYCMIWYV
jgi:hypothetical protein